MVFLAATTAAKVCAQTPSPAQRSSPEFSGDRRAPLAWQAPRADQFAATFPYYARRIGHFGHGALEGQTLSMLSDLDLAAAG